MFNFGLLDIGIGLAFVYLLLSLICSAIGEMIEALLKRRAAYLERGLRELLKDPEGMGLVKKLYDHPLVSGLFRGKDEPAKKGKNEPATTEKNEPAKKGKYGTAKKKGIFTRSTTLPSYIPSRNFALALMDLVLPADADTPSGAAGATATSTPTPSANPLEPLRKAIVAKANDGKYKIDTEIQNALLTLVDAAGNDIVKARENIESWYDSAMERVSSWYKRYAQVILLIIGFIVAGLMNADTVSIARTLSSDVVLRNSLLSQVQEYVKADASGTGSTEVPQKKLLEAEKKLRELGLPLGWGTALDNSFCALLLRVLGWLLTAAAISLGAPFWFDLLNKFMSARSALKPEKKAKES